MCTVSFLPTKENEYILTSNRDELSTRASVTFPYFEDTEGKQLLFPKDGKAGGSWIACSETGRLVCLLNGAFIKHKHQPPYRHSRGLVVKDVLQYESIPDFIDKYPLENIEPFTLVIVDGTLLYELRWDGSTKHFKELDSRQPHIWSSCTLYPKDIIDKRTDFFNEWIKKHDNILLLHQYIGAFEPQYDFMMDRGNNMKTISTTQIHFEQGVFNWKYIDYLTKETAETKFTIHESLV